MGSRNSANQHMDPNNSKPSKFAALIVFSAVILCSPRADAADFIVNFEGIISPAGSFSDPTGSFSQGQAISGFWTLDTATADSDLASTRGAYPQSGSPALQIKIGAHTFSTNATTIQILDDHTLGIGTIDAYDVLGGTGSSTVAGLQVNQMQITLRDTVVPLDALATDALPATAPDPGSFDQIGQVAGQITGNITGGSAFFMNLEIRTTELVVPEPATLVHLSCGMLAMYCRRRAKASYAKCVGETPQIQTVFGTLPDSLNTGCSQGAFRRCGFFDGYRQRNRFVKFTQKSL